MPPATLATATKYIKLLWGDRAHENLMKSINPLGQLEIQVENAHGGVTRATCSSISTASWARKA